MSAEGRPAPLLDVTKKGVANMSVPAPREPHPGGRWETIRYALDTNPRTFRLCLILFVAPVASCLAIVIGELVRHILLTAAT